MAPPVVDTATFADPFVDYRDTMSGEAPRTLIELAICAASASIREKPFWWLKLRDKSIRDKWRKEAARGMKNHDAAARVIDELWGYAGMRDEVTGIEVSVFDKIWQSDGLVSSALLARLKDTVQSLEDVPDDEKDWHPGSGEQVLDLVHPSLYPLVYDQSLLRSGGLLDRAEKPQINNDVKHCTSAEFAWLPTDFSISPSMSGASARALGYINNIHPANKKLRSVVGELVGVFVPLWERVLTDQLEDNAGCFPKRVDDTPVWSGQDDQRVEDTGAGDEEGEGDHDDEDAESVDEPWGGVSSEDEERQASIVIGNRKIKASRVAATTINDSDSASEVDSGEESGSEFEATDNEHDGSTESDSSSSESSSGYATSDGSEEEDDFYDEDDEDDEDGYGPTYPLPVLSFKSSLLERRAIFSLAGRTVQVIVKLANIILTPEQPKYHGGSWHVEGMRNERIVASGIFYYDEENVTESRLAFRRSVRELDWNQYHQNQTAATKRVWGLSRDWLLVQNLGAVQTKGGRCIAFPNVYQHCVQPFRLADKTKLGHRKIVALFLVDPTAVIPSTSTVPPQQRLWISDAIFATWKDSGTRLSKLPRELLDAVQWYTEPWTMSREDAEEARERLMKERTQYVKSANRPNGYFGATFNMCEH